MNEGFDWRKFDELLRKELEQFNKNLDHYKNLDHFYQFPRQPKAESPMPYFQPPFPQQGMNAHANLMHAHNTRGECDMMVWSADGKPSSLPLRYAEDPDGTIYAQMAIRNPKTGGILGYIYLGKTGLMLDPNPA